MIRLRIVQKAPPLFQFVIIFCVVYSVVHFLKILMAGAGGLEASELFPSKTVSGVATKSSGSECFASIHPFCQCFQQWLIALLRRNGFRRDHPVATYARLFTTILDACYDSQKNALRFLMEAFRDIRNPDFSRSNAIPLAQQICKQFEMCTRYAESKFPVAYDFDLNPIEPTQPQTVNPDEKSVRALYGIKHFTSDHPVVINLESPAVLCTRSPEPSDQEDVSSVPTEDDLEVIIPTSSSSIPAPTPDQTCCSPQRKGLPRDLIQRCTEDDQVAGQMCMGLQSLRESPWDDLAKGSQFWWGVYKSVYTKILGELVDKVDDGPTENPSHWKKDNLRNLKFTRDGPVSRWIDANSYCDGLLRTFVKEFKTDVLIDFYETAGTWCQGNANLVSAIVLGIEEWELIRDYMNMMTKVFKADPYDFTHTHLNNDIEDLRTLLCCPAHVPLLVYVEMDAWFAPALQKLQERLEAEGQPEFADYKPNGGHVFVIQRQWPSPSSLTEDATNNEPSFALLCSWRGHYSLGKWLGARPGTLEMTFSQMTIWLRDFEHLLHQTKWTTESSALFSRLFGIEGFAPADEWGGIQTLSSADGDSTEVAPDLLWELHFCCREYDEAKCMGHMDDIIELAERAKSDADFLVHDLAMTSLRDLDALQVSCLSTKQFGSRCVFFLDGASDEAPSQDEQASEKDECVAELQHASSSPPTTPSPPPPIPTPSPKPSSSIGQPPKTSPKRLAKATSSTPKPSCPPRLASAKSPATPSHTKRPISAPAHSGIKPLQRGGSPGKARGTVPTTTTSSMTVTKSKGDVKHNKRPSLGEAHPNPSATLRHRTPASPISSLKPTRISPKPGSKVSSRPVSAVSRVKVSND